MEMNKRTTLLIGCGPQTSALLQPIAEDMVKLGASAHILGYALTDPESQKHLRVPSIPGALHLSPSAQDFRRAQEGSHSAGETIERLFPPTITKVKQAYTNRFVGTCIVFADYLLLQHILPSLAELKAHIPLLKVLLVTALPAIGGSAQELQAIYDQMAAFKAQGDIDALLLFDEFSPVAKKSSKKEQQRYIARCLVSLMKAHDHASEQNPTFEHLVDAIARMGVCGFAFATAPIAQGEDLWWWKQIRAFKRSLPPRGGGNIGDVMNQAEVLLKSMLKLPNTHAIEAPVDPNKPMLYVVNIPLSPADKRFDEVARHIYTQVHTLAHVYPIIVGVSGIPDARYGAAAYFESGFCIYPLANLTLLPAPESAEQTSEGVFPHVQK